MEVGETVIRTPQTFIDPLREKGEPLHGPMEGKVVYIHPKGHYHTVEFKLPIGTVRESFLGV